MAIALDATSNSGTLSASVTTINWNHTVVAGSNLILWVSLLTPAGDKMTTVTWNTTETMTQASKKASTASLGVVYTYFIVNPTSGTHAITTTNVASEVSGSACSYTGAAQTGVPDATNGYTAASTPLSGSITTVATNCWVFTSCGSDYGNATMQPTAGVTQRGQGLIQSSGDSNGALAAGSFSQTWKDNTGNADVFFTTASFAPAPVAAGNFFILV